MSQKSPRDPMDIWVRGEVDMVMASIPMVRDALVAAGMNPVNFDASTKAARHKLLHSDPDNYPEDHNPEDFVGYNCVPERIYISEVLCQYLGLLDYFSMKLTEKWWLTPSEMALQNLLISLEIQLRTAYYSWYPRVWTRTVP